MAIWSIPVGDFVNTGWCLPIPVGDGTFSKIWAGLRSKNIGGLRIMPRYGIKNKKNRFGYRSVPLRTTIGVVGTTQGGERVNLFFFYDI